MPDKKHLGRALLAQYHGELKINLKDYIRMLVPQIEVKGT